jgi:hypothetical protein
MLNLNKISRTFLFLGKLFQFGFSILFVLERVPWKLKVGAKICSFILVKLWKQRNKWFRQTQCFKVCSWAVIWLRRLFAGLSQRRPVFAPGSSMWDLWWTKWHWERFSSKFFGISMSISFDRGSPYLYICDLVQEKTNAHHLVN